jgi:RimJ/RimL family protein N-acetyltransferase
LVNRKSISIFSDAVSFSSIPIVETKRLQVRHLNPTDVLLIQRYFNEWEVTKWLARVPYPYTDADANEFIEHRSKSDAHIAFGIVEKQQNILIGCFGYSPSIDGKQTSIEIGYWIAYEYWHRGYATEAVQEMIAYLYRQFESNCEFIASHFTENAASANVLRKLGFTYMSENCEFMLESVSRKHAVSALRMHLLANRHKCENVNDIEKLEENKLASA